MPRTLTHDGQGHILQNPAAELDTPCRSLRIVGDASSLEIFLNDGAAVLSTRYYPAAGNVALHHAGLDVTACKIFLHRTRIFPHMTFFHARKAYFLGFLPKKRFFMKKPLILRTIFSIINSVITTGIVCP